eukprot:scaffold34646_cov173-Amphora_coffeaeformis.AAC.18
MTNPTLGQKYVGNLHGSGDAGVIEWPSGEERHGFVGVRVATYHRVCMVGRGMWEPRVSKNFFAISAPLVAPSHECQSHHLLLLFVVLEKNIFIFAF